MGKGTDLWDDSALVNAFDHAMAKYKAMHSAADTFTSMGRENNTDSDKYGSVLMEKGEKNVQAEGKKEFVADGAVDTFLQTDKLTCSVDAKQGDDSNTYEEPQPSNLGSTSESISGPPDQQDEEYNQLLQQYYELEEQKQMVLQKLQLASGGNYQTPAQYSGYPAADAPAYSICSQPCYSSSRSISAPPLSCGCCAPCISRCFTSQLPGIHNGTGNATFPASTTQADYNNEVKLGMMAAEEALTSMKTGVLDTSRACDENNKLGKKKGKELGLSDDKEPESICPDPDLAVVLSAWYAAGFHTGRYITWQSKRKTN